MEQIKSPFDDLGGDRELGCQKAVDLRSGSENAYDAVSELRKINRWCWSLLVAEFDDQAFCLCPGAKCVSCVALLCFASGSLKAV
jgi:hypothetical protein